MRPQAIRPLIERAWLRLHQGRDADGMRDVERAHEMYKAGQDPSQLSSICHAMSVLCFQGKRFEEAADWASQLITARPNYAPFLMNRARILAQLGRRDDAIADARQALAVAPNNAEANLFLEKVKV